MHFRKPAASEPLKRSAPTLLVRSREAIFQNLEELQKELSGSGFDCVDSF